MMYKNKRGFAEVFSTLVMFIAVVGVTVGVVFALKNFVVDTEDSLEYQNDLTSDKLKTSISIINIYYNSSSNETNVYMKNIGQTSLTTRFLDVFIDHYFFTNVSTYYANNRSKSIELIYPQETLVIVIPQYLESGSHDLMVKTQFGVGDEDSFNI